MKMVSLTAALLVSAFSNLAEAEETPKIEFEQTVYDFGIISQVEAVRGSFKFKNVGEGVLKLEQPTSSCSCTVATLKKKTLSPGEVGEVEFALEIGRSKGALRKDITVTSNDPQTPRSVLSVKANAIPLYEATPASLVANVPAGGRESNLFISLARTDGEPIRLQRVDTSKPWIVAKIDPASKAGDGAARIQIEVRGDGVPRRFNELVDIYADDKIDAPVTSISVFGQIIGELTFSPEKLFWRITNSARVMDERLADIYTRRLTIRSSAGREFELKNAQSSIKELNVEINAIDGGKAYEIVARLVALTAKSIVGTITFETSLASMPKVEVPVTISVFQKPLSGPVGKVVERAASTGTVQDAAATHAPPSLPVPSQ